MRQRKGLGFVSMLLAATAGLIGMPASTATAEEAQPIAEVQITPDGVDWLPLAEHQGFTLAVAGPQGVVLHREFAPSEVPSLGLVDDVGKPLPDGSYSYELRPLPQSASVLSGYLSVREGSFVVPLVRPEWPTPDSEASSDDGVEVPAPSDPLVIDEEPLVVDEPVCIGEQCIPGNFEFQYGHLTLSSLNPTIKFDDFNFRDWAITVNEPSGASEYFAVRDSGSFTLPFVLSGGAPQHSLFVSSSGNVGLRTSAPVAPLHVKQTASGLTLQLEAAGDLFFRQKNSASGQFVDVNLVGNEFRINFGTGGPGPELRLDNTGNLIITGTYTPDYVFEPEYELMPLAELAEFVIREKHLPNVPNAAAIEAEGLNVNVFPMQLLEKIEELTLYAIAQQRTLDELVKTNEELRARLEAIERDTASSEPQSMPAGI